MGRGGILAGLTSAFLVELWMDNRLHHWWAFSASHCYLADSGVAGVNPLPDRQRRPSQRSYTSFSRAWE